MTPLLEGTSGPACAGEYLGRGADEGVTHPFPQLAKWANYATWALPAQAEIPQVTSGSLHPPGGLAIMIHAPFLFSPMPFF